MEKYYLKSGEEVNFGDTITKVVELGNHKTSVSVYDVTKETIQELIKEGIIVVKNLENAEAKTKIPVVMDYYIANIAKRLGWKEDKVYNYLNSIDHLYPAAALSIILREIAVELDKQYQDHIEKSPHIYVISMFDGRITEANKACIKNYRNFAAFRSIEDAKIACKITRNIIKDLFKSGK